MIIKILVIGTGIRARIIMESLLRQGKDKIKIVGLCDEAPEAMAKFSRELNLNVPFYEDFNQALNECDADWVVIGSMNYRHHEHCTAAFKAGKNIFCEKPLATSWEECKSIMDAYQRSGKKFATGFVLRHAILYRKIKEIIQSGELGKIISVEANELLSSEHGGHIMRNWRRYNKYKGSHILEKCCHDIDLLNWIIDSVPVRIASFSGLNIFTKENHDTAQKLITENDDPTLFRSWPQWEDNEMDPFLSDKDTVDNQVVIMEYRNGTRVSFHTNCCSAFVQRRMLFCGLEGTLEADLTKGWIHWKRMGTKTEDHEITLPKSDLHGGGDDIIAADLLNCMLNDVKPKASGREGLCSAITCFGIEKAEESRMIVDIKSYWKQLGI